MTADSGPLLSADLLRNLAFAAGRRYWPSSADGALRALAVARLPALQASLGDPVRVTLPSWASDLGTGAPPGLLVDRRAIIPGEGDPAERCDWWIAAGLHLSGATERAHEARHGPIHSYAFRLRVGAALFDHAWVNRILLFLRRAAARALDREEGSLFGPLPSAEIVLTHDVDALTKDWRLRLKQGGFTLFNGFRFGLRGQTGPAVERLASALRFAIGPREFAIFDILLKSLNHHGLRSRFHFYAGPTAGRSGWPGIILNPAYDASAPEILTLMRRLRADGFEIGIHPSFASWRSPAMLQCERLRLETLLGAPVIAARQHWLRFSWRYTWAAQAAAGIKFDQTLGFNDRPGFRNGAALPFAPLDPQTGAPLPITALPLILMDSHLYDYDLLAPSARGMAMERWIAEVRATHGMATVLWHPHTLHPDYGWRDGFETLLDILSAR
jgi:hypothetical protein